MTVATKYIYLDVRNLLCNSLSLLHAFYSQAPCWLSVLKYVCNMSGDASRKRKAEQIGPCPDHGGQVTAHRCRRRFGAACCWTLCPTKRSGRPVAVEAVPYVQTLNITKSSQMYLPAARRFATVEEVNILCLLEGTGETDVDGDEDCEISSESADCIPPFLSGLRKLPSAFLGGFLVEGGAMRRAAYDHILCWGPEDHGEVFRGLASSLFAACQTGALRREIHIIGLMDSLYDVWPCSSGKNPCRRCRNFVQYLPISHALIAKASRNQYPCMSMDDFWKVLTKRPRF